MVRPEGVAEPDPSVQVIMPCFPDLHSSCSNVKHHRPAPACPLHLIVGRSSIPLPAGRRPEPPYPE
jgi:hypothetical protein